MEKGIRKIREEQGYTLSQVAEKARLSVSYLSEIERGGKNLLWLHYIKLPEL